MRQVHLLGGVMAGALAMRRFHLAIGLAGLLGVYARPSDQPLAPTVQWAASLVLGVVPLLFALGFMVEPGLAEMARPWSPPAIYLGLVATLAHVLAGWSDRAKSQREAEA